MISLITLAAYVNYNLITDCENDEIFFSCEFENLIDQVLSEHENKKTIVVSNFADSELYTNTIGSYIKIKNIIIDETLENHTIKNNNEIFKDQTVSNIIALLNKSYEITMNKYTFVANIKHLGKNEKYDIIGIGGTLVTELFTNNEIFYPDYIYLQQWINHDFKKGFESLNKLQISDNYDILSYSVIYNEPVYNCEDDIINYIASKIRDNKYPVEPKYKFVQIKYKYMKEFGEKDASGEYQYLNLMRKILDKGNHRDDRTGTGTVSLFGESMRFDISESIPLLTTKNVPFKTVLYELLWMLQGHTDAKILQKDGVKIWNGNTSREFLDRQGLTHYPEGVLGAGYGWQLRHQGAIYDHKYADLTNIDSSQIGGFDQLQYIENLLKTDPFSRRIMFSYWNPSDFDKTALQPCHVLVQFYVEEINGQKHLSCQFYMRSSDCIAWTWNICAYSTLTYILAKKCNMLPKEIIYTVGDCHIYKNHVNQVREQLTRTPRTFPKLHLDDSLSTKDWSEMAVDDFELIGYFPYPPIKMKMAI